MSNLLFDNPALYEARFPHTQEHVVLIASAAGARLGPGPWRILDLGSGTGRDAAGLAALGHSVTGVDLAPAMVEHARHRYPSLEFRVGDLRGCDLRRQFDVVSCMDSALLYCLTHRDLGRCLRVVRRHLRPGGVFVAEMRNGAHYLGRDGGLGDAIDDEFAHDGVVYRSRTVLWIDHAAQLLRRRRTWTWPGAESQVQESAWRLIFPDELRGLLETNGFTDIELSDEDGTSLTGRRLRIAATSSSPSPRAM
ncbi:MAG: class I SAM-dependent methyltransferase [Micropruina sp.]|uniref:class I SAM-dependent methyltransferase n=1 Tax=Micropruina sp. TaxID=2737536 RepID=UPI0039E6B5BB